MFPRSLNLIIGLPSSQIQCLDSKKRIKPLRWPVKIQSKECLAEWKSPGNISLSIGLGIVTLDSEHSLLNRQSELFLKAEPCHLVQFSWNSGMSDVRQESKSVAQRKSKRSRTRHGRWWVLSFQPVGSLPGQRLLCPHMEQLLRSHRSKLSAYRTGCILCVSCLLPRQAWLTGWSPIWNGLLKTTSVRSPREQWARAVSLSTIFRSHQLTPPFNGDYFLVKWVSFNIYNILWWLDFKTLFAFSCISRLRTVNETFIDHHLKAWNKVSDSQKLSPGSFARGMGSGIDFAWRCLEWGALMSKELLYVQAGQRSLKASIGLYEII